MRDGPPVVRRRPVGALLAVCVMTGILSLALPSRLPGQISPGPLARPHASLEGAANCVKCHGLKGAGSPMTQVCLQCHKEIGWLMQQQRGLHAREVRVGKKECASCHPDHAGADFKMVEWAEGSATRFDHRKAGWSLEGKHGEAKCESCHATKYRTGQAAKLSERKSSAGWVGLERDCMACHESDDVHDGALAATCESCHDARTWDTAPTFDHDKADYRLDGKHTDVACDKCHLTPRLKTRTNAKGEPVPLFKPVPFKECASCHADPHKGRLSAKCSECHVTRGFEVIDQKGFNHALTRYPLKGAHVAVACAPCHGNALAQKNPPFTSCASCHADAHGGEGTLGGRWADCAACHRVEGFAPSTFTVAQHRATAYPLEGKHEGVKCAACHPSTKAPASQAAPGGATQSLARSAKLVRLKVAGTQCAGCHEDAHGSQLASRVPAATCEACHAVAGFAPSTFGIVAHATLRLPLEGMHATIACAACHGAERPGLPAWGASQSLGSAKVALTGVDPSCTSCHVDPHAGRYSRPGGAAGDGSCRGCHGSDRFRPSLVDVTVHAGYALPLEGAHRAVPCVACHEGMAVAPGAPTPRASLVRGGRPVASLPFSEPLPRTCATCHETMHGDQFAGRPGGADCASCHAVDAFAPAPRFDHERASFSLKGAHATVACAGCHKQVPVNGAPVGTTRVLYRPLSATCESCHTARNGPRSH